MYCHRKSFVCITLHNGILHYRAGAIYEFCTGFHVVGVTLRYKALLTACAAACDIPLYPF